MVQCARILEVWVEELGLDPAEYGMHSMRRTKAPLIGRSCCFGSGTLGDPAERQLPGDVSK
jgi:hypothetical protein